ncbi:MAG: CDP-alcohol phosphatidyltransferase family protein [Bacteroidota bacterium]
MPESYRYRESLKSDHSDELINTYLLRPLAGILVFALYRTPVTPNHVTVASIVAGLAAAGFYATGDSVVTAGLLVTLKDLLDSADGQLARAKQQFSRRGRFLDSIGDMLVGLAVFSGIGWTLVQSSGDPLFLVWSILAFASMTFRISYHVFYHTSYLHLKGSYQTNRLVEEITDVDREGDKVTLHLHQIFQILYGWQDRLILKIDSWCRRGRMDEDFRQRWYGNRLGLLLSGFLGIGTELFLLMLFSVAGHLGWYLGFNIVVMNGILAVSIFYRRIHLAGKWDTEKAD